MTPYGEPRVDAQKAHSFSWVICALSATKGMDFIMLKKGVVIVSHGFGEHSGSYDELAVRLGQAGYKCVVFTQRGHGELPVKQKGIIPGYQCFLDDLNAQIAVSQQNLYAQGVNANVIFSIIKQPRRRIRQRKFGYTITARTSNTH